MVYKTYYVYILANQKNGTLYVGMTNNLVRRVHQHRNGLVDGFTKKHRIHQLVYFESHSDVHQAIAREKRLKRWRRQWKIKLIEKQNPGWKDLYESLMGEGECWVPAQKTAGTTLEGGPRGAHCTED